jgi:signal transduction histidine kinase
LPPVPTDADVSPNSNAAWSGRRLRLIGLTIVTVTFMAAATMVLELHERALDDYQREVANLSTVLADQTQRYVQVADVVLQEVQGRVAMLRVDTPEAFRTRMMAPDIWTLLHDRLRNLPQANAFVLLDANGELVNSSRAPPLQQVNGADRAFFQHLRTRDDPGLFVSAPLISRVTGEPTLFLARRINGPDHRFLGVVIACIDLKHLAEFYANIGLPAGESVTLLRRDGLVIVRYPDPTHDAGRRIPTAAPWYSQVAAGGGTYRSPGYLGGKPALVSAQPLTAYPLVIDVSVPEKVALAAWRQQALLLGLAALIAAAGFIAVFRVLAMQFRRQQAQNAELQATTAALRASEQRLAEKSKLLETTLEHMDQGLMMIANDRTIPVSNSRAAALLGFPPELLAGRPRFEDVLAWQWSQNEFASSDVEFQEFVRRALLLNGPRLYERTRPNGQVIEVRTTPLPDGEAVRTFTDVTERHAVSVALAQEKERAEAANRAKSEFLANMSHELRTPLNAIIGFAELIRDQARGPLPAEYVQDARDIHASGQHLLELINEVLDLSKIEAGRYDFVEERLDLRQIVPRCASMVSLRAREGEVRVQGVENAAGLVLGDRRAIQQVLLNVLGNAVKFTPPGGSVSLRTELLNDGGLALVVADTGIGIEAAALRTLCEPFRQADASISRRFGGTGLGLAISRKLLAWHDAALEIESRPEHGTTVRILFPKARVVAVEAALQAG